MMLSIHYIKGKPYIYCSININCRKKWFYVGAGTKIRLKQINATTNKINAYVLGIAARRKHKIDLRSYAAVFNKLCIEAMEKEMLVLYST